MPQIARPGMALADLEWSASSSGGGSLVAHIVNGQGEWFQIFRYEYPPEAAYYNAYGSMVRDVWRHIDALAMHCVLYAVTTNPKR